MKGSNRQFWVLVVLIFILTGMFAFDVLADDVKIVRLNESKIARINISTRGTVLSFPAKPTKVILGRSGSFGIEYVENDLAISPLNLSARSNLFVYLLGRRFSFDLVTSAGAGSSVIQVRDSVEGGKVK